MKKTHSKPLGFTIFELIIVLAVGSLIIVMVLLAVSAANRSSRDTKRKADALSFSSALEQWAQNHSGNLPTVASGAIVLNSLGALTNAGTFCSENYLPNSCADFKDPTTAPYAFVGQSFVIGGTPTLTCGNGSGGTNGPGVFAITYSSTRDYKIQMCLESGMSTINP